MNDALRLEARLREELAELARFPVPRLSERVLARLPERRARPRTSARVLAAAAVLLLGLAAIWTAGRGAAPATPSASVPQRTAARPWLSIGAPVAPEAALRDEARRLASDTRRTAASLWDRLPLTSFLTRGSH